MIRKIIYFTFVLLIFNYETLLGQHFTVGIDVGMITMFTKVKDHGTGVFINHQTVGFDLSENSKRFYINYLQNFEYEFDYTRAIYSSFICTRNNFLPPLKGKDCIGETFNVNQINLNVGKKIFEYKKFIFTSYFGIGFVFFENFFIDKEPISPISGGSFKWHFASDNNVFRENNININSALSLKYKVNPLLNLNIYCKYQQGIFKIYENNIVAWQPDNIDVLEIPKDETKLRYINNRSNGSNFQIGIGIQYRIKGDEK